MGSGVQVVGHRAQHGGHLARGLVIGVAAAAQVDAVEQLDEILDDRGSCPRRLAPAALTTRTGRVEHADRERLGSPRRPSTTPNSTRVPGLSADIPAGSADGVDEDLVAVVLARKPKPFSVSYHLTLPVGTTHPSRTYAGSVRTRR